MARITLQAVSKSFGGRDLFSELSLEIHAGTRLALVGPNGCGKSTLLKIVAGEVEPDAGSVHIPRGSRVGYVEQELSAEQLAMALEDFVLETIPSWGEFWHQWRAAVDAGDTTALERLAVRQAELEAACRAANIRELIASLPDGYDTVVGERGHRLSGGEKQRLAIARVILKDPRILVLDEATSHLDSQSEALIQKALQPLLRGRTSVVIAHRLSTILAADKIVVIDKGRVIEQGTHHQLLANGGLYSALYETQFRSQIAEPI
jgi:ATP-binding cassette subfamily B protein